VLTLYAGSPPEFPEHDAEAGSGQHDEMRITLADTYYAGLDTMRLLVEVIAKYRPDLAECTAGKYRSEWNVLFPGRFPEAPPMSALAATCSERRLHAESHQLFRIVNAVADLVSETVRSPEGMPRVVVRGARFMDIPSLRAVLRLVEPGCGADIVLADLLGASDHGPAAAARIHERAQLAFLRRVEVPIEPGGGVPLGDSPDIPAASLERDWWTCCEAASTPAERIASALVTMRAAFFSTNYRGGVTAAYEVLDVVDSLGGVPAAPAVVDADAMAEIRAIVASAVLDDDPGSIGLRSVEFVDVAAVVGVTHRYLGMLWAFLLHYRHALRHFGSAIELGPTSPLRARARLLRALLYIKRIGDVQAGFTDVHLGLAELGAADPARDGAPPGERTAGIGPEAAVEAAWLYNVQALGYLQLRDAAAAEVAERRAIRLVARLASTDATHLKVNLISNLSVLAERSGDPGRALDIWRRFTRAPGTWSPTFVKNFSYREANLLMLLDRTGEALTALRRARDAAGQTGDDYYGAFISLGGAALLAGDGRQEEALSWYQLAEEHADRVNDDYLRGLARLGRALLVLTGDRLPDDVAADLRALFSGASSHPAQARATVAALEGGDPAACRSVLPAMGQKLNRPFVPVRLEFRAVS
jgi:tetratricopeptide (TPR) repeat protein